MLAVYFFYQKRHATKNKANETETCLYRIIIK